MVVPAKRPSPGLEARIHELRFPPDFMFQLTPADLPNLKSQIVISSHGGARSLPYAFTEQGVAMLSSVLRSPRAIRTPDDPASPRIGPTRV